MCSGMKVLSTFHQRHYPVHFHAAQPPVLCNLTTCAFTPFNADMLSFHIQPDQSSPEGATAEHNTATFYELIIRHADQGEKETKKGTY